MSSRADERIKRSVLFAFVALNTVHHRKCGVRGFIYELFVSKPRTSDVRASEGL